MNLANEIFIQIEYLPNFRLYAVLRDEEGKVYKQWENYVAWDDKDIADYIIPLEYVGGDLYISNKTAGIEKAKHIQIFMQRGKKPSKDDQLIASTVDMKVKDYPKKYKPTYFPIDKKTS